MSPTGLEAAFLAACRLELEALKPGNVHRFADGHGMTVATFEAAALAAAGPITQAGAPLGRRILAAVEASVAATGCNTNLGIILLAAPLLMAAEADVGRPFRERLTEVLDAADVEDTRAVYAAIRIANPGGLGRATAEDVASDPTTPLRAVMALAADGDRVARQYAESFVDVFEVGLPALRAAEADGVGAAWAATRVHMTYLARFPDTHVARKFGPAIAEAARAEAAGLDARWESATVTRSLTLFDRSLKARGLNPGTTADLTVATLLLARLPAGDGAAPSTP